MRLLTSLTTCCRTRTGVLDQGRSSRRAYIDGLVLRLFIQVRLRQRMLGHWLAGECHCEILWAEGIWSRLRSVSWHSRSLHVIRLHVLHHMSAASLESADHGGIIGYWQEG